MDPVIVFWFLLFGYVGYHVVTNESDAEAVNLFFMGVWVQIRKYYYMVKLHPFWITNPIGQWWMMRKYRKMAEEIRKEFEVQNCSSDNLNNEEETK